MNYEILKKFIDDCMDIDPDYFDVCLELIHMAWLVSSIDDEQKTQLEDHLR